MIHSLLTSPAFAPIAILYNINRQQHRDKVHSWKGEWQMKYILFTIILLFSFTGCKDPDPKPTDPEPTKTVSEECKVLETIYAAYNKLYTCGEIIERQRRLKEQERLKEEECVVDFKKTYSTVPTKIAEQMTYFHYFYTLFKSDNKIQNPPPPKAGQTDEEALKSYPFHLCIYKKLKDMNLHYDTNTETVSGGENIETAPSYPTWDGEPPYYDIPPGDIPPPSGYVSPYDNSEEGLSETTSTLEETMSKIASTFKQCFKELGEEAYQENKQKFNCQ